MSWLGNILDPRSSDADAQRELERIQTVLSELALVRPGGAVTAEALAALRARFGRRAAELRARRGGEPAAAPGVDDALSGEVRGDGAVADPGRAPAPDVATSAPVPARGPSLQEFLADRSILIVSYLGAFLLVAATLLFELYGPPGLGGSPRFAAVLALDLVFGAAGFLCLRNDRLRLVGTTYVAIFALIAPLVFVAGYVFLVLRQYGISATAATAFGAASCTVLYGLLGARLGSRGYATLSAVAFAIAWYAAADALGLLRGGGVALTPLVLAFAAIAFRTGWLGPTGRLFATPAGPLIHASALAAILSTYVGSGTLVGFTDWRSVATLAGLTLAYVGYCGLASRPGSLWVPAVLATLAITSGSGALGLGRTAVSLEVLALAWCWLLLAPHFPNPTLPGEGGRPEELPVLRILAGALSLVCALLTVEPAWLNVLVLLGASGVWVVIARRAGQADWLVVAVGLVSLAWYSVVGAIVPPPAAANLSALATAYAPLPPLLTVAGGIVGWWRGHAVGSRRRWGTPFYVGAVVNALWMATLAGLEADLALLGRLLLLFAAVCYAAAAANRFPVAALVALLGAAGGVAASMAAADASSFLYAPALAALAWVAYAVGFARPSEPRWLDAHRLAAGLLSASAILVGIAIPGLTDPGSSGALALLAALWSFALLARVEARRGGLHQMRYAAGLLAVLGVDCIASYLGARNLQAYTVGPGLWLLIAGELLRRDRAISAALAKSRGASAAGALVLMGTTALQAFGEPSNAWAYSSALAVESVLFILGGIALRNQVLVLGGTAGVALAVLRALSVLVQEVPLFAVFGLLALGLLAAGAALAVLRDRFGRVRSTMAGWDNSA